MHLSVSEQLTSSTVRIECHLQNGQISTGTGFFFRFEDEDSFIPVIVTNKHVIKDAITGSFHIDFAGTDGRQIGQHARINLTGFESGWINHPDPNVDLCVLPVGPILNQVEQLGRKPFFIVLDKSLIFSSSDMEKLTALEEIIMIGYPNGIWDPVNNQPIIRRGITATHPNLSYEGRQEFMIDAACFPGSSGSPVFLFNQGGFADRDGNYVLNARIMLLGILYAGPQYIATGEIKIVNVPTQNKPLAFSRLNINLGCVIKAQLLFDFEMILKNLSEERKKI